MVSLGGIQFLGLIIILALREIRLSFQRGQLNHIAITEKEIIIVFLLDNLNAITPSHAGGSSMKCISLNRKCFDMLTDESNELDLINKLDAV